MSGRRGFLALVGGAAVSGLVMVRPSAARPTLIMPPALVVDPPTMPAGAYPLLAGHRSQMHAFIEIKKLIPDDYFLDWLEGGLRTARMFKGRDEATMERLFAERGDRPLCEGIGHEHPSRLHGVHGRRRGFRDGVADRSGA